MHNQLEQYLSEVAEHLHALPVARRNEELREMRQHLQNAVIVKQEFGQSEDEAVQAALEEFGSSEELGEQVVRVWRRGRLRHGWTSSFATAMVAGLLLFSPNILVGTVVPVRPTAPDFKLMSFVIFLSFILLCLLVGRYIGRKLSRETPMATVATTLFSVTVGTILEPFLAWGGPEMQTPFLDFGLLHGNGRILLWLAENFLAVWALSILFVLPAAVLSWSLAKRRSACQSQ